MPSHPNFTAVTHPLPTVSSYIPSLLNGTPFRVSLHSWAAPVPSRATKAMAHDESMVYYEAKVLLDGICTAYVSIYGSGCRATQGPIKFAVRKSLVIRLVHCPTYGLGMDSLPSFIMATLFRFHCLVNSLVGHLGGQPADQMQQRHLVQSRPFLASSHW